MAEDDGPDFGDVRKAIMEDDFGGLVKVVMSSRRLVTAHDAVSAHAAASTPCLRNTSLRFVCGRDCRPGSQLCT